MRLFRVYTYPHYFVAIPSLHTTNKQTNEQTESDRDGVRVVIELKRDANPQVVENNLFKKTQLQTSFSGNMLALGNDGNKVRERAS